MKVCCAGGGNKQRRKRALPPPELLEDELAELNTSGILPAGRKSAPGDECSARSPPPQRRRSTGALSLPSSSFASRTFGGARSGVLEGVEDTKRSGLSR